jgi:outer membrane protein insertion porin family
VVNQSRSAISDKYADNGYAFVEVRPVFEVDRENRVVSTVFTIDPKQRVYVRKIEISGNTYTRDEIIRRELRQFEGSWYSAGAVQRSRDRLNRLGFFDSVTVETPSVPGTTDQVDLQVVVVERETGSIQLSAGYSDSDGALIGANYLQRNVLGTGRELSVDINTSDAAEEISIGYVNPYYTADGVSRGFNFTRRKVDSSKVNTAEYILDTTNLGMKFKIPIAETNSVNLGFAFERLELEATEETPPEFLPIIELQPESDDIVLTIGVSKDTRNDFFFPTRGGVASLGSEITAPGSDFEYYKVNLQGAYYLPVSSFLTLKTGAGVGYGDGYGDTEIIGLPFFKNYFAGGSKSVRGYRGRSLGPRDSGPTPQPIGGSKRLLLNAELLLPAYGEGVSKDKRLGFFVDGGQVWSTEQDFEFNDMRYSAGIVFNWFSPLGPFSLSYGEPLNDEEFDDIENFQISFGTVFR